MKHFLIFVRWHQEEKYIDSVIEFPEEVSKAIAFCSKLEMAKEFPEEWRQLAHQVFTLILRARHHPDGRLYHFKSDELKLKDVEEWVMLMSTKELNKFIFEQKRKEEKEDGKGRAC